MFPGNLLHLYADAVCSVQCASHVAGGIASDECGEVLLSERKTTLIAINMKSQKICLLLNVKLSAAYEYCQ